MSKAGKIRSLALLLILCLSCAVILGGCGGASQNSEESRTPSESEEDISSEKEMEPAEESAADEPEEAEKTLIVYFSHTGTTKGVSEYLHNVVGGDIFEIEPVSPYPEGYSDALDPAKEEQRKDARPEIKGTVGDFDSYEVIYLGYPIWWGTTPMIIKTFLESYDFSGKTVVPYATSGGTGIEMSIEDIRSEIPDADVKEGLLVKSNDDIIPWLKTLGLYK